MDDRSAPPPPLAPAAWEPLLAGADRERALGAIDEIARSLSGVPSVRLNDGKADATLGHGLAGVALFYWYLGDALGDELHHDLALGLLDRAIEAISSTPMGPSFVGGFTGIAWTVAHVDGRRFGPSGGDPDGDPNEDIDAVLAELVSRPGWEGMFDLWGGLVGLGVYALERLPRPQAAIILDSVVRRLEESAVRHDDGVGWWSPRESLGLPFSDDYPDGCYNLGLPHGTPGVVALLAQACAAGVATSSGRRLLADAMRWLLARRLAADSESVFPRLLAPDLGTPAPARSAWCYGDPGVASALLFAGRAVDSTWEREARAVALRAARRPSAHAGVVDASLCHGSAGLAHVFNRLHQSTGDEELRQAAGRWVERTLAFTSGAAWRRSAAHQSWEDPGLITGAAGVGLGLLAAATGVEPAWDRALLLSSGFI